MAITNGYCTLQEFKDRLGNLTSTDAARDRYIEQMIEAASRWIDTYCSRRFYAATETLYFTAKESATLKVTDLISVTTLKTDADGDRTYETTWATTDYDLMPYNYTPKQWIEVTPNGLNYFPTLKKGVEIVGSWGYASTTPDAVNEACLLKSMQLYKRRVGINEVGGGNSVTGQTVVPSEKAIADLLAPYRKMT